MTKSNKSQPIMRITVFVLLALTLPMGCKTAKVEERQPVVPASEQLAKDMVGTWVHVGRPGNVREAPPEGGRLKFRTGKHWTLVQADASGLVIEQFGGTYTLNGNEYVETQQYGDATWMKDNGKSFKFTVKVEGDTMTQIGIDNPYTEVWKRAK